MYGPGNLGLFTPRADFMSLSLLVLGISSFLFHASLRQTLQFADELSMLGLAWSLLQGTLTVRNSTTHSEYINICLAIVFPLFSVFYVWTGKIIYHATAFAAIIFLISHTPFVERSKFPYIPVLTLNILCLTNQVSAQALTSDIHHTLPARMNTNLISNTHPNTMANTTSFSPHIAVFSPR